MNYLKHLLNRMYYYLFIKIVSSHLFQTNRPLSLTL